MRKKLKEIAVKNNAETGRAPKRGTHAYKTWVVNAVAKHPHRRTPEEQAAVEHEMDLAYRGLGLLAHFKSAPHGSMSIPALYVHNGEDSGFVCERG